MGNKTNRSELRKKLAQHLDTNYTSTQQAYAGNCDDYVFEYELKVNGKKRNIVTYKDNKYGCALHGLHTTLIRYLKQTYSPSVYSFAYKDGVCITDCLKKHLSSDVFLKADIHSFFETVDKTILLDKVVSMTKDKHEKEILPLFIDCCFYKGRMPIGFASSPVLSDIYLQDIDKFFGAQKDIVYTRYADDFILSASGENAENILESCKDELIKKLGELGLSINSKKTYIRRLSLIGDAIHLLGLNIVKDEFKNRITVSDSYIRETCKDFCKYLSVKDNISKAKSDEMLKSVCGKIQFIVNSSERSAMKLSKMIYVKSGTSYKLDYKTLSSI